MSGTLAEIARLEKLAEAAYDAMYDARPPLAKAHYEGAMLYLGRALAEAERIDDVAAFERLTLRRDHFDNVFQQSVSRRRLRSLFKGLYASPQNRSLRRP